LNSLKELGIEYDEIHFGKPYGDIYIDDKAFNTFDLSLFQQIGFYDSENSLISYNCNHHILKHYRLHNPHHLLLFGKIVLSAKRRRNIKML
jgi:hypothetical protein